jgi:hypothetical protein
MASYPKLGSFRRPKRNSGRKCVVCGVAPAGILDVEVNWFRGDDLCIACCGGKPCKQSILCGSGWPTQIQKEVK